MYRATCMMAFWQLDGTAGPFWYVDSGRTTESDARAMYHGSECKSAHKVIGCAVVHIGGDRDGEVVSLRRDYGDAVREADQFNREHAEMVADLCEHDSNGQA
jgi:hypothetical protein